MTSRNLAIEKAARDLLGIDPSEETR